MAKGDAPATSTTAAADPDKEELDAVDEATAEAQEQAQEARTDPKKDAKARGQFDAHVTPSRGDDGQYEQVDSAGNTSASKASLNRFLKLSGYEESDVIGSNEKRQTFVTDNGGKYTIVGKKKARVRVLGGPPTPVMIEEAAEEDEEE